MAAEAGEQPQTRLIWDLPTRLTHWSLALCFAGSWITAEAGFEWTQWHFRLGYCALGLVLFRLIWGFVGPTHARFSQFVRGPKQVGQHIAELWRQDAAESAGHNPLGALAVLLLLGSVALQAATGLFVSDDIFYAGPYNGAVSSSTAGWLASIHHLNFRFLQALVALHLLAIAWYWWRQGHRLLTPMLTGRKDASKVAAAAEISDSKLLRAVIVAVIVVAAIWLLLAQAPPPAPLDDFY